jgi:hypothetical protein
MSDRPSLEVGVSWYLNVLYRSGASPAEVIDVRWRLFHCFRNLFDAGFISERVIPALPEELESR